MSKDYFDKLYNEDTEDIVPTKDLINFVKESIGTTDSYERTKVATSLIIVKATRAQTQLIKEQVQTIEKQNKIIEENSKSSDRLGIMGLIFSWCLVLTSYSQIIVSWNGVSKYWLWGNALITVIFLCLLIIIYKGKRK